ncbi:aldo/keto reductase [Nocardia brasiliensis]|uniref:Aldo/keto reductase n=1 Tax=Nocardia brasiliensis (strain ATCC 700358 / HUJEG-1) TaxID=1133849 RepID=K0EX70_NOCB7|nr:aldo/keto reductase [Nocardia brasiliensis]AFU01465.1 aldo/keto reductase [Nocardia brasiliensis ATCC 700358]OCF85923.1 aldo/keto reductase [Nocardia brasiliensis]
MTDLTDIVLGGAGYAGLYRAVDPADAHAALSTAWDAGIRSFDTAPHYGVGSGEERLGEFLRTHPRAEFTVSTKAGRLLYDDPQAADGADGFYGTPKRSRRRDYSAAGIRRSLEDSLTRLGLDRVDLLLIHDPEDHQPEAFSAAVPELVRLRDEGLISGIGVGVNFVDLALRFVRAAPIDHVLIAGRYTLLDRGAEAELLPECDRRGIRVLVGGVLNSGILADPERQATFDYRPADGEIIGRARAMARLCAEYEVPLRAAALQFPRRHPAVTRTVVGASTADQVADTVAMLNHPVPEALWDALAGRG